MLAELPDGVRVCYQFSGVTPFGQEGKIVLLGTAGVLCYDLVSDRLRGVTRSAGAGPGSLDELPEVPIPAEKAGGWRVEADFVDSIRAGARCDSPILPRVRPTWNSPRPSPAAP